MNRRNQSPLPYSEESELALVGWSLLSPSQFDQIAELVDIEDFKMPSTQAVFAAITSLRNRGEDTSDRSVAVELERVGELESVGGRRGLADMIGEAGVWTPASMRTTAATVISRAKTRAIIKIAAEASQRATGLDNPDAIVDDLVAKLSAIDRPDPTAVPDRLTTVADFVDAYRDTGTEWVIPGLLRRDWRVIVVAPEGVGKSMMLRSVAGLSAQGIHPFTHRPIPAVRSLVIDLENPDGALYEGFAKVDGVSRRRSGQYDRERSWLWRRPEGLNLRSRADVRQLERVLQAVRPDVVALGPLYNAFRRERSEDDQEVVIEVQHVISDLRTRYGFAFVAEHHAPHGSGGHNRELRPFGSSAWLRWPELGLSLRRVDEADANVLEFGRWRGDRVHSAWPRQVIRDATYLFGTWDNERDAVDNAARELAAPAADGFGGEF